MHDWQVVIDWHAIIQGWRVFNACFGLVEIGVLLWMARRYTGGMSNSLRTFFQSIIALLIATVWTSVENFIEDAPLGPKSVITTFALILMAVAIRRMSNDGQQNLDELNHEENTDDGSVLYRHRDDEPER